MQEEHPSPGGSESAGQRNKPPETCPPLGPSGGGNGERSLLQAAITDLSEGLGDRGAESRSQADLDEDRRLEVEFLENWADERGLWFDHRTVSQLRDPNTREHLLFRPAHAGDRIFKLTKGSGFGLYPRCFPKAFYRKNCRYWFEDHAGTPLQYLKRLSLSNSELMSHLDPGKYPELNRLEGFMKTRGSFRIVTSQPFFVGVPPSVVEIANWFRDRGFAFIAEYTWFRENDHLAVFDTWEKNLMIVGDDIVPFDVIPIRAEGLFLEKLQEAEQRMRTP